MLVWEKRKARNWKSNMSSECLAAAGGLILGATSQILSRRRGLAELLIALGGSEGLHVDRAVMLWTSMAEQVGWTRSGTPSSGHHYWKPFTPGGVLEDLLKSALPPCL